MKGVGYIVSLLVCVIMAFGCVMWGISARFQDLDSVERLSTSIGDIFERRAVKDPLVTLNGGWCRLLGRRRCNGMVKLPSGHLVGPIGTKRIETDTIVSRMIELKEICDKANAQLLFVQTPYRNSMLDFDGAYPSDTTSSNADNLMGALTSAGIDALDLRQSLRMAKVDIASLYYKTDNHWTLDAAMFVLPEIVSRISGKSDVGSWRREPLPWKILGAYGRKTGRWYCGLDEFAYFVPTFKTEMQRISVNGKVMKRGTFEQVVVQKDVLTKPDSEFKHDAYAVYGRNWNFLRFKNDAARHQGRILILRDSYARPIAAYMTALFSDVVQMDLRDIAKVEGGNKQTVSGVIASYRPNMVLVMYNSGLMVNPSLYQWR